MSWINLGKRAGFGIALAIACSAGAAPLVVKSSGPSAGDYPAGKAIATSTKIALKAGDTIVILDGRGTRTLKGPGVFSPTASSGQLADSRETFDIAAQRNQRARIGAVRGMMGVSDTRRNPNIWFVDIGRSSNVCVTDPRQVTMWRGGADQAAIVTLTRASDGKATQVAWGKDQALKAWPADMPVADGAEYRLSWTGAAAPTTLRFMVMGNPSGIEDTASMLIKAGCTAQLDLLIETVAAPGAAGAPNG